ncbi:MULTISPECIES: transposase [unclassified Mesorhizobium]|uniref:transposase n=1 Tax=unclassified Mesorhizobium TaxID=325217 RepID=UPI001FDA4482|nr:transposase [Mesorhizobium sp. L103C120A0]
MAAVRDIRRFREPQKLVSYFGLNPRRSWLGAIWPDQQTCAFPCPRHAGRGRLAGRCSSGRRLHRQPPPL